MPEPLPSWQNADVLRLAQFARIRLVVADLDGTLIDSPNSGLSHMIQALNRKLGSVSQVLFTIATGRAYAGVARFLDHLSIGADVPVAVYNGSLVIRSHSKAVLLSDVIPPVALSAVVDICMQLAVPVLAYSRVSFPGWEGIFDPSQEHVLGWSTQPSQTTTELNGLTIDWQESTDRALNVAPHAMLIDLLGCDLSWIDLTARLAAVPDVNVTRSGTRYLELRPKGANKGRALRAIAKDLGVDVQETLVIGDNDNDAEMLSVAGIGVTVANASQSALANSSFICRHGVDAGAVEVLRVVREAKRYGRFFADSVPPLAGERS